MDNLLREKLLTFAKENIMVVGLGIVGLIFLGYGLISLSSSNSSTDEITFESFDSADKPSEQSSKIMVDVEGGVEKPGVYSLASSSRVQDVLIAAGGLSEGANREWVRQHVNLAAKVTDGAKIYIPLLGEGTTGSTSTTSITESISINTASESELDKLPGIGPVTAQKIIAARPYSSLEELLSKKVISNAVFEKIKEKISL